MGKTLTFELPDEIYEAIRRQASLSGRSTEETALEWLARSAPGPRPGISDEGRRAARERLRRHAGAVDSGDPGSADNDRIDADLASEFESPHEGPA